jgi:cytochrome c oxidase cbb3-type subunit III
MSAFWHWFIVVITFGNIFGCIWLIWFAGNKQQTETESGEPVGHVWDDNISEMNHPMPRWWLWLFYATIIFGLIYLALYPGLGNYAGALGWTQERQHAEQMEELDAQRDAFLSRFDGMELEALMADPDALAAGARVFAHNCALCHGSDARGAVGFPNLADGEWQWGGSAEEVLTSIRDGRQGVMPALGEATGDEAYSVAAYTYHLNGRTLAFIGTASMERGEQQFQQLCTACHGADGTGNKALGAPDLTNHSWTYGGTLEAIQATVQQGRHGIMPAHSALLSEQRIRLVTAYVLSLGAD